MGKRAKTARSLKRKMVKRAAKAARRALYESYAGTGANKKSKRFRLGNRRANNAVKERIVMLVPVIINGILTETLRAVHKSRERCGNVGCRKPTCRKV
jgi:hypothetical protein